MSLPWRENQALPYGTFRDLTQCDLPFDKQEENGLKDLMDNLQNFYESFYEMMRDNIVIIEFDLFDCKRSPFVKKIINIYSKNNTSP